MIISDTCIRRPVATIILMSAIVVFGIIGFQRLGVDLFPRVELPVVTVTTYLAGASPETIEADVTDPIEERLNEIEGLKHITSVSALGVSQIVVEFVLEKDIDTAAEDVRAKVSVARSELPEDVDPPIIDKLDIEASPIMWLAVSGTRSYREISQYADKVLKRRVQTVRGVGYVRLGGFREREIKIWLDREKLNAHALTAIDVTNALKKEHIELPAGRLETGPREFLVKTMGEFQSPSEFNELIIAFRNGTPLKIKDVGYAEEGLEDIEEEYRTLARFNGKSAAALGISKQTGTNTVAVAEAVKKRLAQLASEIPPGIKVDIAYDASKFIEASIRGVQTDLLIGVVLVVIVIGFFLRSIAPTFVAALAIPTSLIGTFAFMYFFGFTANNLTMIALSIAVGLVVDDAIVVLENIFRHMEEGRPRIEAASFGTSEIAFAIIAATSSICAVFIPVAFMGGIIGRFFFQFGVTVAVAVALSLLVSLTLTPMACSRVLRRGATKNRLSERVEKILLRVNSLYRTTLRWALVHRFTTLGIAIGIFLITILLGSLLRKEFVSAQDESHFLVYAKTVQGASIEYTDYYFRRFEGYLREIPEIKSYFTAVGTGDITDVNEGYMFVNMLDINDRKRSQQMVMAELRHRLWKLPGVVTAVSNIPRIRMGGLREADVNYVIKGPSLEKLEQYSDEIKRQLKTIPGIVDIDSDLELSRPETRIYIDREKAGDLGITVEAISTVLNTLVGGVDVVKYKELGERYDVNVRLIKSERDTPKDILNIAVPAKGGGLVALSNVIDIVETAGPANIRRYDRQRAVQIYANVEPGIKTQGEALADFERVAANILPRGQGYRTAISGRTETMMESFGYLFFALYLAIIIIYMVLAAQFESFIHPFTVMLSLPLSLIGAFGGLLIAGQTLNIFSLIGFIMMMGLVTKNAILLVDYTNTLRSRGMERTEALLTAGPIRLRPILMTALTTIFAMLPIALGYSEGGEARAPMGVAVVGGMTTSTFLTLIIIPVVYSLFDDLFERLKDIFLKRRS
jgi:HAE1 family hydrophobic/amphiphilic exporter-1